MRERDITYEMLLREVEYDPSTGDVFRFSVGRGGQRGYVHKQLGYRVIRVCGASLYAHRLAWCYVHGKWPTLVIDHINGDKCDNRISNLREVSRLANAHNRFANHSKINSPGVQEVSLIGGKKVYRAKITVSKRQIYLGTFDSVMAAQEKYIAAKAILHEPVLARG